MSVCAIAVLQWNASVLFLQNRQHITQKEVARLGRLFKSWLNPEKGNIAEDTLKSVEETATTLATNAAPPSNVSEGSSSLGAAGAVMASEASAAAAAAIAAPVASTSSIVLENANAVGAGVPPSGGIMLGEGAERYQVHYCAIGEVFILVISMVHANPFAGSACLLRVKSALASVCRGTEVTTLQLSKRYGEILFALERILEGGDGLDLLQQKLSDIQPHAMLTQRAYDSLIPGHKEAWSSMEKRCDSHTKEIEAEMQLEFAMALPASSASPTKTVPLSLENNNSSVEGVVPKECFEASWATTPKAKMETTPTLQAKAQKQKKTPRTKSKANKDKPKDKKKKATKKKSSQQPKSKAG
ncbi:hypothetical protein QOT17_022275 [Balamuthia mandrillaris]